MFCTYLSHMAWFSFVMRIGTLGLVPSLYLCEITAKIQHSTMDRAIWDIEFGSSHVARLYIKRFGSLGSEWNGPSFLSSIDYISSLQANLEACLLHWLCRTFALIVRTWWGTYKNPNFLKPLNIGKTSLSFSFSVVKQIRSCTKPDLRESEFPGRWPSLRKIQ